MDADPCSISETAVSSTVVCLTVSRDLLQQKLDNHRRALLAEALPLVVEYVVECLWEIDGLLEECFATPQLGLVLPAGTSPALAAQVVKESLFQRVTDFLEESREVETIRKQRRRPRPDESLVEPVRTPITSGQWAAPVLERMPVLK